MKKSSTSLDELIKKIIDHFPESDIPAIKIDRLNGQWCADLILDGYESHYEVHDSLIYAVAKLLSYVKKEYPQ